MDSKKYVLLVCNAPYTYQGADTALSFAKALVRKGHTIVQIFFYHDGVYVSSRLNSPEQSERQISSDWVDFAGTHQIELVVCSNAAMKRGILDQQLARQVAHSQFNLDPQFKMAGLGQLAHAVSESDRLVSFGY